MVNEKQKQAWKHNSLKNDEQIQSQNVEIKVLEFFEIFKKHPGITFTTLLLMDFTLILRGRIDIGGGKHQ